MVTDKELSHLTEIAPSKRKPTDTYIGYVVPGDGPANEKRNAIYDQECLELVYDPNETYLYGILPIMPEYRGKQCAYCGKILSFPVENETVVTTNF